MRQCEVQCSDHSERNRSRNWVDADRYEAETEQGAAAAKAWHAEALAEGEASPMPAPNTGQRAVRGSRYSKVGCHRGKQAAPPGRRLRRRSVRACTLNSTNSFWCGRKPTAKNSAVRITITCGRNTRGVASPEKQPARRAARGGAAEGRALRPQRAQLQLLLLASAQTS